MAEQPRHKLLVVDDSSTIRNLVKVSFERENIEIFEAGDGIEALNKVAEVKPDIVLLDVTMPKLDGLETLQILRENDSTKGLPVILVTALGDPETVLQAKALGISDYIVKPFNRTTLLDKVKKVQEAISREQVAIEKEKIDRELEEVRKKLAATSFSPAPQEKAEEEVKAVQAQDAPSVPEPRVVDGYEVEDIPLNRMRPGQVLALPVYLQNKAAFLKEGTALDEKTIRRLRNRKDELERQEVTIRKGKAKTET